MKLKKNPIIKLYGNKYEVTFNNPLVYLQCVDNLDNDGIPQPDVRGSNGWRNVFYDLKTPVQVARMIVYNKVVNGWNLSHLDGWATFDDKDVTIKRYNRWTGTWAEMT